jgi:hypothetical protein
MFGEVVLDFDFFDHFWDQRHNYVFFLGDAQVWDSQFGYPY